MEEGDKSSTTIDCLLNNINETQETIRSYDTKAEILGILMTLVVGFLNYNLISDYKCDSIIMGLIAAATFVAITALALLLTVLFPSRNPAHEVDLGKFQPKNTYFVFKKPEEQFNFDVIYSRLVDTEWQKELLFELLKLSAIRDRKHKWFTRSVKAASLTLLIIVFLVGRIGYVCTTR